MINVILSYQVKPEFVGQNKLNSIKILENFKKLDTATFEYNTYTIEDGVTFVHVSSYRVEKVQAEVLNVPSFEGFQRWRDESGLHGTHKVEVLKYVGSANQRLN